MPTDRQIALMCDIGQTTDVDAQDAGDLAALMGEGFVEAETAAPAASRPGPRGYRLTRKGETFLSERGAGLNEA